MTELVPPTVPVPLAVLLDLPGLGLRQVAGPREDRPVYAVHTSEMEDPVPYLLGGEMLLSAGVHCPDTEGTGSYWDHYVARTVQAGAAALGFGIAPVHDTVPRALVEACDQHGLPLVEVPRQTTFTAVARAMWQAMAQRRHHELRRMTEAQQALASAAARAHPVPAVLRQLAQHVGGWAVLLGQDGAELSAAGIRPERDARSALTALAARLRPGPSSAADTAGDLQLSVYGLPGPAPAEGRLALGVCAARRDAVDGAIAGVAVVLLSLLTGPRTAGADAGRSAALVRLMLGTDPAAVAPLLVASGPGAAGDTGAPAGQAGAAPRGADSAARPGGGRGGPGSSGAAGRGRGTAGRGPSGGGPSGADASATGRAPAGDEDAPDPAALWTVVHGRRRGRARAGQPLWAAELAAGLGTSLVDVEGDELRALVPGGGSVEVQPGWSLGASPPVPAGELARGDTEAARALRRALAERAPLVRHRADAVGGLGSLVPADEARSLARTRLAALEGAPALVETLRVWLSLHGSWDRTAVALDIHRNTVRQRIARAAELLDTDLGDPDVRMELWFALKWL
ncbi:PucR family transcriptional regulator [Streptomyces sp. NPDC004647]|uniref:PucR family transcriptional regulator n=1 Tax=Streptomyces sp. NPDC004647 TaxID=3154671 RepID=UPI00339F4C78